LLALLGFVDGHIYQDSKAISINLNIEALIAMLPTRTIFKRALSAL